MLEVKLKDVLGLQQEVLLVLFVVPEVLRLCRLVQHDLAPEGLESVGKPELGSGTPEIGRVNLQAGHLGVLLNQEGGNFKFPAIFSVAAIFFPGNRVQLESPQEFQLQLGAELAHGPNCRAAGYQGQEKQGHRKPGKFKHV